ncbi:MAG TPA: hypothetical protein VD863_20985, partial [Bradyrhizobium sp.]|nr:hypothetical protein [Bradyrhizobium sp.]
MVDIILPAGTKMRLLAAVLQSAPEVAFKVYFHLLEQADRQSGVAILSKAEIAAAIRPKPRSIRSITRAIEWLETRSLILVDRKMIGHRPDGSAVFGGERGKNRYRLVFQRGTQESLTGPECRTQESFTSEGLLCPERGTPVSPVKDTRVPHTLSLDSTLKKFPSRAGARAAGNADAEAWSEVV